MTALRERTVFSDDRLTVTAIESLELRADRMNHMRYVTGDLQPIAIVVKEQGRTYALDMAGQSVAIDRLNLPR
jgi:hypothetical protein